MIYMCADWHFNHNKDFIYKSRGFSSVEEMNKALVYNHNKIVRPDDDVYVLGDLMLGADAAAGIDLIKQLNGDLHIVYGNHDTERKKEFYKKLPNFVEGADALTLKYKGYHFYLSHYPSVTSNLDYDKPLKQRLLNICGHSHTNNPWNDTDKGYIYHVEMDAQNNTPISLENIIIAFKQNNFTSFNGKWKEIKVEDYNDGYGFYFIYECSRCGNQRPRRENFCNHCGMDMREMNKGESL